MSQELNGPTPGADRIITFHVGGHEFRARRPSRGDEAEIKRVFARKLARSGAPLEADLVGAYDGAALHAEAELEVLLQPRLSPRGEELSLGERVPEHWLRLVKDDKGAVIGRLLSFDDVDPAEFEAVVDCLHGALQKKSGSTPPRSTGTAPAPSSG